MMGESERVVLDISSDEEVGSFESTGMIIRDDYDWITELLNEGDSVRVCNGNGDDDSDDVVVVGEVISNPKNNLKSVASPVVKCGGDDDDDDDCVVLEEDPDKPVEVENGDGGGGDGSDDVLVVSEKGQIACRDYPHPRHLCAKFPFGSTPHERHCEQCHCYVCDILAPCDFWQTGVSSVDHCHATDKERYWKVMRQNARRNDKVLPLVPTSLDTSVSVPPAPPMAIQTPGLAQRLPNYLPRNQAVRQAPIRPCSMSSGHGYFNRRQFTSIRDKFHSDVVSQQLRNASINVTPRDRRHHVGHVSPQFFTNRTAFKRTASSGPASTINRLIPNPSNTRSGPQMCRVPPLSSRWQEPCGRVPTGSNNYLGSSQPNAGILGPNAVSCLPQQRSQPSVVGMCANFAPRQQVVPSQLNASSLGANNISSPHQLAGQPTLGGVSANYRPMGPERPSAVLGANDVSFQSQLPRQANVASVSTNFVAMEPVRPSQSRTGTPGAKAVCYPTQMSRQANVACVSANYAPMDSQMPSQPQVSIYANSGSSEAPVFSQPHSNSSPSQTHLSTLQSVLSDFESFISSENAVSSQSQVNNVCNYPLASDAQFFTRLHSQTNSTNSLPQQNSAGFHPVVGNGSVNTTASQYPMACSANASSSFRNSTASVSQLSHEADGRFQPELCGQHISSLPDSQHVSSQQRHQSENVIGTSFEDFDFSWETHGSLTNSSGNVYSPKPAASPGVSGHSQLIESTDINCDDWLVSGPTQGPVSTGFHILSPEAPSIDAGFFVDL